MGVVVEGLVEERLAPAGEDADGEDGVVGGAGSAEDVVDCPVKFNGFVSSGLKRMAPWVPRVTRLTAYAL